MPATTPNESLRRLGELPPAPQHRLRQPRFVHRDDPSGTPAHAITVWQAEPCGTIGDGCGPANSRAADTRTAADERHRESCQIVDLRQRTRRPPTAPQKYASVPPTNNIVASQNSDASAAPIRQAANAWTASSARRQIARQDHDRSIELIAQSAGLELEPRPRAFRTNEQMVDLSGLLHHPVERLLNL